MITNENDFLGLIISCADESHNCKAIDVVHKSGMSDIDCLPFIKSLEQKNLIKMTSMSTIHVYPQAYEAHVSTSKKVANSVQKASKFTLKTIFEITVGVIVAAIAAFIIYYFGWQ